MNNKYKVVIFDLVDTLAFLTGLDEPGVKLEDKIGNELVDMLFEGGVIDKEHDVETVLLRLKDCFMRDSF